MDDKELIAKAAAAVGGVEFVPDMGWIVIDAEGNRGAWWNPICNDRDALRLLAVIPSLWTLALKFGAPSLEMDVAWGTGEGINVSEWLTEGKDRVAALRRVIVRAAAEIGKHKMEQLT